jgi:XTP/dITP diphosphohydrolase
MSAASAQRKHIVASGNPSKLKEYQVLAEGHGLELELLPNFDAIPPFPEEAPTFAENAAGKANYYSKHSRELVFADDSGLVVPALDGAPGVLSARYAGSGASSEQRNAKLLAAMRGIQGADRAAYFVCVIALAKQGRCLAVVSAKVEGEILDHPCGFGGFGYDPIFYFPLLHKTLAEITPEEKNQHSHRGKAFRRLMEILEENN